jgi:hypothetical protein
LVFSRTGTAEEDGDDDDFDDDDGANFDRVKIMVADPH